MLKDLTKQNTSSISSQVRWLRNWLPVIKIIFRELQQILSKSIAYYVKIKFQSQLDFDCTKPFKAIRSALNVKIVVEIELAPKLPFFDKLWLSDNFSSLVEKLIFIREPDFVFFAVFAPVEKLPTF